MCVCFGRGGGAFFNIFLLEIGGENKDQVICPQWWVGKHCWLRQASFPFLEKPEFHLVPQITERSFWWMQLAPLSCKLISSALPRALKSQHTAGCMAVGTLSRMAPEVSLCWQSKEAAIRNYTQQTPTCSCHSHLIQFMKVLKCWHLCSSFSSMQLSEFRTIILLKCFRCHISNP